MNYVYVYVNVLMCVCFRLFASVSFSCVSAWVTCNNNEMSHGQGQVNQIDSADCWFVLFWSECIMGFKRG